MVGFCCSSRTRARALVLMIQVSLFFASSSPSLAADTLAQGQFIKDDGRTTIVSSQKVFELGFFSPGKSPYRYVGIWYHGIVPQATVWVANRDAPLRGSNGSFGISATGLVVLDGNQTAIWSSSSSSNTSAASNSSAQLMDSGNLVIRSPSGAELWQSFDNPTDTFIPGMRINIDLASRRNHIFKSWRTADDPATGNYSVGLDPNGSFQIYMWEGGAVRWRSGQWDGGTFLGSKMRALFEYGFKLITDGKKNYFTFATNRSLYRFVMQPDGVENTTIFDNETRKWSSFWSQPINECDFYNHCDANSVCSDVAGGGATCECLPGYETRSAEESSGVDRSGGGCSRRMQWQCERNGAGEADGFKLVEGMKLPDFSEFVQTASDDAGCRAICSRNCSCRAYSFVNGYGCFVWGRDLVDMHHFDDGTKAGNLYIKLAGSELDSKKTTWILPLVLALLGAVLLISCLCLWWKYRVLIREWWKSRSKQSTLLVDHSGMDIRMDFISRDFSTKSDVAEKGTISELSIYQFEAIVTATDNFSPSNKLGQGGFGEVFKGRLPWGEEIAVKRLSKGSGQGLEEFKNEALLIAKLQHRNLVRLLGCCVEKDEKILVYEYLQNKSLDAFLFDPEKNVELDWKKRLNIIEGIARGLLYLHRDSRLKIVHRDLKASNILLDEEMNPKISDFGMARIFEYNQNQDNTNRVVGTFGYMSPEYAMEGLFSVKSDIYSFGVLLLEIISGRKNSSFYRSEGAKNLVGHAWKLWNEDKAMELVDPSIKSSTSSHEVLKYIHLGLLCVQDRAIDRPIIEHLVNMLGNETTVLVMPKQPTYTLEGIPGETDSIQTDKEYFTSNDVTVTSLSVR